MEVNECRLPNIAPARGVSPTCSFTTRMVDDGVLLLQDGALLAAWTFRGPDMASATHGEMAALSARLEYRSATRQRLDDRSVTPFGRKLLATQKPARFRTW